MVTGVQTCALPISCLELKQNAGTARSKVRLQATPTLLRQLIDRRGQPDPEFESLEPLSALATLAQLLAIPTMQPRLTTWYRRAAMTAESGRLRITLDERLTFCRPQRVGVVGAEVAPSPADVIAPGPARVLEIKHWGERPLWLDWALDGLEPARDFSKFRIGMAAMTRKLHPAAHPYAAVAAGAAEGVGEPDTNRAIDVATYFAPAPGTA